MGSNTAAGWTSVPLDTSRVVVVGDSSRNVELMAEVLAEYQITPATSAGDLNPVLSGGVTADLVIVDTGTVDAGVAALIESLVDERFPVLLLSEETSPTLRENAEVIEELSFREKPVRAADLCRTVDRILN